MNYETDNILEGATVDYTPVMALIVYESGMEEKFYLESHDIVDGKLGAGAPLSTECISDIAASFSTEQSVTPRGVIPLNLLYADNRTGQQKYIWYNPPKAQQMYFSKALGIPDGLYHIPGILYVTNEEELKLYAFKGNKPANKLYKAPFFNVTNGRVCLGSARLEYPSNPSYQDILDYWEKKFWLTEFTHLGGSMNPTIHNLVIVTKESKERFDNDEMLPISITLNDLFR